MPDKKPIDYKALKSHAYNYDKLQAQYGGKRFDTRGSKYLKDDYNKAWEEYSKANPNADKKNFRSIYTTDVANEEEITPWQQRARAAVLEADKLATEDEKAFRDQQSKNFSSLDPEQKQIRGKKALQALSKLKGPMTDDLKTIMKQVGFGDGVQRNRDLTDEEFGKLQGWLESRSGTGLEDDSNSILQNLYANNPSPLKRRLDIQQGPNYVQMSERLGSSIDQAIQERQQIADRAREEERRARMDEMQQLQLATAKMNQYESLNVPADTNIPTANEYLQGASRALVNEQAALVNALKNNEIDTDEFASKSALIKSQVPALQATKEALTGFQNDYTTLLENRQLSQANDDKAGLLYNAMQTGNITIAPGGDGKMYIRSADDDGQLINMPLEQVSRLPKPIAKAQPLNLLVKDTAAGLANKQMWDDDSSNVVRQQLDNLISSGDELQAEKILKSIAVDSLNMSLEEANELLNTPVEDDYGNTNALEQAVEQGMIKEAEDQWRVNENKRQQEAAITRYKQAQAAEAERQARLAATQPAPQTPSQFKRSEINQNALLGYQNKVASFDDFVNNKTSTNFPVGNGNFIVERNGQYVVLDKNRNLVGLPMTADQVKESFLSGYDNIAREYVKKNNPIKKTSSNPFKRLASWFNMQKQ